MTQVTVIGAGLAGCEAAYQLAVRGIPVRLLEMKPKKFSPAHKSENFCELVCSNSLRSAELSNAAGLLKEEMRRLGSLVIRCADENRVPAGSALAVDREGFSRSVTETIRSHPLIEVAQEEVTDIPSQGPVIIASGPLTEGALYEAIADLLGEPYLHFFDAAAPVVTKESIDFEKAFYAARYGKGGADYINCPMNREEYLCFYRELIGAQTAQLHGFEGKEVFEGCMPVEVMARRGEESLLFGPLKPVGLVDPRTDRRFAAVVQLRQDNREASLYNMVGFQTNLLFGEQKRVFSMIPGLEHAEFVRYGVMHRNTFIQSPKLLNADFSLRTEPRIRFAGQITGVEGYIESAASGYLAGLALARELCNRSEIVFPRTTALGALSAYIAQHSTAQESAMPGNKAQDNKGKESAALRSAAQSGAEEFQPMNINFGIIEKLPVRVRGKREKNLEIARRSLEVIDAMAEEVLQRS